MTVRYKILVLILALVLPVFILAQNKENLLNHPDRYKLDLPKEWQKPKFIEAITDVLSQTIDELKDRDFCTEGKAAYYVRLTIDSISVTNQQTSGPVEIGSIVHYNLSFDYSFNAGLLITDSLNSPVSVLRLVSAEEPMTYSKQLTTRPQNAVYRYEPIYNSMGRVIGRRLIQEAPPVNTYVPKINPFAVLTREFLMNICEQKIYEIRKMLKKLNQD